MTSGAVAACGDGRLVHDLHDRVAVIGHDDVERARASPAVFGNSAGIEEKRASPMWAAREFAHGGAAYTEAAVTTLPSSTPSDLPVPAMSHLVREARFGLSAYKNRDHRRPKHEQFRLPSRVDSCLRPGNRINLPPRAQVTDACRF